MLKSFRVLVASALLAPVGASAGMITVDFTVTASSVSQGGSSYAGYPLGTVGVGSFTFDDSVGDFLTFGTAGITATDLSFDWLGMSFDETTAQIWHLDVGDGGLRSWGIGAAPCALICIASPGPDDFFVTGYNNLGYAAAHVAGAPGFTFGALRWTTTSVPEPATLGLFGLGLLGAAAARRRRVA
jgi:hypothetical protein